MSLVLANIDIENTKCRWSLLILTLNTQIRFLLRFLTDSYKKSIHSARSTSTSSTSTTSSTSGAGTTSAGSTASSAA